MAKQTINVGSSANDGTGDKIRIAFQKTNSNFTELYDTKLDSVVAGDNITIDNTDPLNPVINSTGGSSTLQEVTDNGNTTTNSITVQGVTISGNADNSVTNVGADAGQNNTGSYVLNIGTSAGFNNTGDDVINLGEGAGLENTGNGVTNLGVNAGRNNTGEAVSNICTNAGAQNTGDGVTNIGMAAGYNNTGNGVTNLGAGAGYNNTFDSVINLGINAQATAPNQLALNTGSINTVINLPTTATELTLRDSVDVETIAYLSDISASAGVPYTGATANVNLGEFELKAGQVTLDTTPTGTATEATTQWNDTIGSSQTTLKGGSVVLKNGVDLVARIVNKVTPNTTLTKANYQVVKVSGAQGQRLAVSLAQANSDNNSADTLGIVCETIATNQEGFILTVGQLEEINTSGSLQGETWADGDVLYLSPTTAGKVTNVKPTGATGHIVILGYVEYAHSVHGKIYVKIMNGWELDELHNVYISSPTNNQGLIYESSTSLWKNKTVDKNLVGLGNVDNTSDVNKPVSTATQTQLNKKVENIYKDAVPSSAVTGTTSVTILKSYLFSGGTYSANDIIDLVSFKVKKTGTNGTFTKRIYLNTSNTLTGAVVIATVLTTAPAVVYSKLNRTFTLNGGNLEGLAFNVSNNSDVIQTSSGFSTTSLNPANDFYLITTIQLTNSSDSVAQTEFLSR